VVYAGHFHVMRDNVGLLLNSNAVPCIDGPELDPLQPLKIPESRLLLIYFAARGAAGRTDCCSRMAGL
jgi:hypothetical protein